MTQIDQIIADALAGSPETHVAILAREVLRLREAPAVVVPEVPMGTALQRLGLRLSQILDGDEFTVLEREFLNPAIREEQAVAVPAWDVNAFALSCVKAGAYAEGNLRDALKNAETGYNFVISRARAIPADRVLGEGMVAISGSLATLLQELVFAVDVFLAESSPWIGPGAPAEVPELTEIASRRLQYMLDQICANQGGGRPCLIK